MPVKRIDSDAGRTHGFQAYVPIPGQPKRYVSRFFADRRNGGRDKAHALAYDALPKLKRAARRAAK